MNSLVSVLIPAYNAEPWIADTIEPALAQTWPRKEIVVVVGSTDRTLAVARRFESSQVLVTTKENQGAAATRNKAFSLCQGDYIQWLDANEGQNGYPELFLNLRWVGIALLAVVVGTGYVTVVGGFRRDPDTARLRLGYFVAGVAYNVTEAGFRTMNPVWIVFLWAIIAAPKAPVAKGRPGRGVFSEARQEEMVLRRRGGEPQPNGGWAASPNAEGAVLGTQLP
jgi:glycosyltransferase involved in cell wall biosynthesis